MLLRALADLVVLLHLGFILFVALGGLLALRWRWIAWLQIPSALWGILIELRGWICPLTPLENRLRELAGAAGYPGGFVEHYVLRLVYPGPLTPTVQLLLALLVVIANSVIYFLVWRRVLERRAA